MRRITIIFIPIIIILIHIMIYSEEKEYYKWTHVTGKWSVSRDEKSSFAFQTRINTILWNYNVPSNHNTIATNNPISKYSSIKLSFEIVKSTVFPASIILFFSARNYHMDLHAFKFDGDENNINRLSFIKSVMKDRSKPTSEKANFEVSEISSSDCLLDYNKKYNIEINIKKAIASIYVDGKKLLESKAEEPINSGIVGFGVRGPQMKIYNAKIYNGKKVVLQDDFSQNSIKVQTIVVKKMTKEQYEKMMKEKEEKEKVKRKGLGCSELERRWACWTC